MRTIFEAWWPLAASWLLMGLEVPLVSAGIARMPEPVTSLAAYGGVVFPLALLIEAPIVMFLAASTALSKDWASYRLTSRFMYAMSLALSALHVAVAFTPLYDLIAIHLLHAPAEIIEPSRIGLRIMTPWTFAIAYRRFHQGVLIRFGRSRAVGVGTMVRLLANLVVLVVGARFTAWSGIVVGTLAVACGVVAEALCAGWMVRPLLRGELRAAAAVSPALTSAAFIRFYAPLAATPMLLFFAMPLASAAMGRMPRTIESLAVWPVVNGLVLTLRSTGFAFNEVVVSLLDRPHAVASLRRFARLIAGATTALLVAVAVTPLGGLWFSRVSALDAALVSLAVGGVWLGAPLPALTAYYSGSTWRSRR